MVRDYIIEVFADVAIFQLGMDEGVFDPNAQHLRIIFGFVLPRDRQGDMGVRIGLKAPRPDKNEYAGQ